MSMKLVLSALMLASLALPIALAPTASAWPPVCIVREADVLTVHAEVWITCGPRVVGTVCSPVDEEQCTEIGTDDGP
jgi:hypothetical protein